MNILDLHDCMITQIFEHLPYDEVAKKRLVCKRLDAICQSILNHGFMKIIRLTGINLKKIKSKLPRRESERSKHPLAKHAEILSCMESTIFLLRITYDKYINAKLYCFIPGKVIDEVLRLLRSLHQTRLLASSYTYDILLELRDISKMAIDHFKEKISVALKETKKEQLLPSTSVSNHILGKPVLVTDATIWQTGIVQARQAMAPSCQDCLTARRNHTSIVEMKRHYNKDMTEMRTQIADLRRRLDESEAKNRVSANISHIIKDTTDTTEQIPQSQPHDIILKRCISGSNALPDDGGECSKKPRME